MSRADRAREARELRDRGLLLREIGERMGAATSTVDGWLNDPDGARLQARKDSYAGVCVRCGAPTDGSNGRARAAKVCKECWVWEPDVVLAAVRRWAAEHDGYPPTEEQWRRRGDYWPSARTVLSLFGSWDAGIRAAGFRPFIDRRAETQAWVEQQIAAGRTAASVARDLGVSESAVRNRLKYRGLTATALRRRAAA